MKTSARFRLTAQCNTPNLLHMQITLSAEQRCLIEAGVRAGRYRCAEDAVEEALAEWECRQQEKAILKAKMRAAAEESGRGEGYAVTELDLLVERVSQRVQMGGGPGMDPPKDS